MSTSPQIAADYALLIRPTRPDDANYITKSFAESYGESPLARHIHAPVHRMGARHAITSLARRGLCVVAHPPTYDDLILGWCCIESQPYGAVVHYVYVKKAYRRAKVGSALVSHAFSMLGVDPKGDIRFSHWRQPAGGLARKRGWRFDPYSLIAPVEPDASED